MVMHLSGTEFSGPSLSQEDEMLLRPRRSLDSDSKETRTLAELIAIARNPHHEMHVFVYEFLILLTVCHTVIPEGDKDRPEGTRNRLVGILIFPMVNEVSSSY
jgi:hypothetical protein